MNDFRVDYLFKPFKVTEVKCRGSASPRPRSGHRIACDDVNIYCFGGYNPTLPLDVPLENPTWTPARPLFKELWSFSIATRKWKQHNIANMPEELASNAMCMNGRYLMVHGGTGAPFGSKCSNDVLVWRTQADDNRLQVLDVTGSRPPGLYGQSILCYDGGFYTVGGTNGYSYNCDIFRLDLRTMIWESEYIGTGQEGEPMGRYRHELARIGENLYIIGGGTGDWAYDLMELPVFNLKTKTWTILTPKPDDSTRDILMPLPRKCHSAVQISTPSGEQVFVAGGTDGQAVFEDIWRLNLSDLQWNLMQKTVLPHPLYFHSSAVTSTGCMYVFGGIEPRENATSRNNILYKVWLCIPSLSEICWEALLNFYPNLDKIDRSKLISLGIPLHLVHRINPSN
ncbi:kelch domain-containing protein 10 homolog [Plodia interpunctella]|uniref:kelch domain-containing protein 10 homolog n=1 Tax=Plodia interpunctella TaxID=58824 RepID=UPI00236822AA|nr:kelch domain-containing protein 10 homolog [Plodia interpunctella]